jgi:tetratricopeptide (TPR) repeat protein
LNDPDVVWPESAGLLADALLASIQRGESSEWQVLEIVDMKSAGGATLTRLDDGSVLASGTNPDSDRYTIVTQTDLSEIAAIRIEALTDPSLPQDGPGRDNTNDPGNFAINKLTVNSANAAQGESPSEVVFDQAWADRTNHPQESLLEGHWNTGGGGGRPHQALFRLKQPISHDDGARLVFQMQFQTAPEWPGQNLGRFRLSVAADAYTWRNTMLAGGLKDVPGEWDRLAAAYYLSGDTQALNRLLEHKPQAAAGIGDLYASSEDWEQAVVAYSGQILPKTADADLLVKRGEAYARLTQWDNAKSDWQRAAKLRPGILQEPFDRLRMAAQWHSAAIIGVLLIEQDPENRFLWLRTAPTFVLAGDEQGYRQFCASMLDQFADTKELADAEFTCKARALMPGAVDASRLPLKVVSDALDQETTPGWLRPWHWATRALVAYRSDDRDEAARCVQQAFNSNPNPPALALCYSIDALEKTASGNRSGAREALEQARKMVDEELPNATEVSLHDWTIALILVREAEKLLEDAQN